MWAADTSTSDISYYFSLESRGFSGDSSVVEPDPEPKPCSLTCPNGELDEVNCLCICPYGTGKNGACCPNPGKDAARCLTALQLDGNGCDTYVSACSDGKVCDGAGQCVCAGVCDLENYAWDEACTCQCILDANACTSGISYFVNDAAGCRCVACPPLENMDLTCPISNGVDENGCLQYREKTQADCLDDEVFNQLQCRCVACPPLENMDFTCPVADGTDANGCPQYREKTQADCLDDEVFNASQCRCEQCPGDQVVIDGVCVECGSDADCNPDKPYCNTSSHTCVSCLSAQHCNIKGSDGYVCENGKCKCKGRGSWIGGKICCSFDVCTNFETQEEICYKDTEYCCVSGNKMWISDSPDCGTQPPECDNSIITDDCEERTATCKDGTSQKYLVCKTQCGEDYTGFPGC